jgi:hypothetical protein
MASVPPPLDLGKLLRLRATVMKAAQVDATYEVGRALIQTYLRLRGEVMGILGSDDLADLRAECERLFPVYQEPPAVDPTTGDPIPPIAFASIAREAGLLLTTLEGWIQGLIEQLTFEQRMRIEAEAKAAHESRPLGFGG